jgi:hypothetical protein
MRSAVKKPAILSPAQLKAQTPTDILARTPQQTVAPKASHSTVDPKRLKKATQMIQSPAISRYSPTSTVASLTTAAPYVSKPAHPGGRHEQFAASGHRTVNSVPTIPVAPVSHAAPQPDIFEQALARATSHEQKHTGKKAGKRGRVTGMVTAVMCLLLLIGAFAYFNAPALSMRMASNKAGFNAKLPSYSPAGFSFGNLSYGPGNVTVSYKADESRKFDITQRTSGWDSQALLTNFVSSANKAYQTYERAGRTVYLYGNNTATWVDSGVWYTVNGNSSLTKNQLLDLAGSM